MREQNGDLFELAAGKVLVITTNGTVRRDGACVMGRGCAAEIKRRMPRIPHMLGDAIASYGNQVFGLAIDEGGFLAVLNFPVKHNWWEHADLELIAKSAQQLKEKVDHAHFSCDIFIPRPGCGNGKLSWESVRRVIEPILNDDRFVIVDFG